MIQEILRLNKSPLQLKLWMFATRQGEIIVLWIVITFYPCYASVSDKIVLIVKLMLIIDKNFFTFTDSLDQFVKEFGILYSNISVYKIFFDCMVKERKKEVGKMEKIYRIEIWKSCINVSRFFWMPLDVSGCLPMPSNASWCLPMPPDASRFRIEIQTYVLGLSPATHETRHISQSNFCWSIFLLLNFKAMSQKGFMIRLPH